MAEAERLYRAALRLDPSRFDALHLLGVAHAQSDRLPEARALVEQALRINPRSIEAHQHLAGILSRQGRHDEAVAALETAVRLNPRVAEAHHALGVWYKRLGRAAEATACYGEAIRLNPDYAVAHFNLAVALHEMGRLAEAIGSYREALRARPGYVEACVNLGGALQQQGRIAEAIAAYEQALRLQPRYADAHNNLGVALEQIDRLPEAVACYREAVRLKPDYADAHSNLGAALGKQGRSAEAVGHLQEAVRLKPDFASAHYNLGNALLEAGRPAEAADCYRRATESEPHNAAYLLSYLHVSHQLARWEDDERLCRKLEELRPSPRNPRSPFPLLALPVSADCQKRAAIAFAESHEALARVWKGEHDSRSVGPHKLRVGYLSADFKNHPTSHLIAEILELHDKTVFDIVAYSFGRDDGSAVRKRIQRACTEFHDIQPLSTAASAKKIHADHIDILVDLMGYTAGSRSAVLAMRPAPVQINWLGYPGTMGTPAVDYIIADPFVIPKGAERFYTEKIIYLPDTYQPNDRQRPIGEARPRRFYGLPEEGFVFCCFNQTFKILPGMFAIWMEVLEAVPGSVLWLLQEREEAGVNLRREAGARGVSPERLIFAGRAPLAEHLARYRAADLALDTFPYTSHTTASDALWVGCPLVTLAGETFASRVAGSLLRAAGLPELVSATVEEFRSLAVRLATSRGALQAVRAKLARDRETCPLFDTPRFVAALEAAYRAVWDNRALGQSPDHVALHRP